MRRTFKADRHKEWAFDADTEIFEIDNMQFSVADVEKIVYSGTPTSYEEVGIMQVTVRGQVYTLAFPFVQRLSGWEVASLLLERVKERPPVPQIPEPKEIRMRCKVCGQVFCYNADDIKRNEHYSKSIALHTIAGVASALAGRTATTALNTMSIRQAGERIIDFTRCPNCRSQELEPLSEEVTLPQYSVADELKKWKDLLDSGAITEEEYDAQKKRLLGM